MECARRARGERFRRAIDRPQSAASAILAALSRVNAELFARTAGHDDYVTAGVSLSAVLIVRGRAAVLHCGGTAAYLVHRGGVAALTRDDAFDDASLPLLARALCTAASLDVTVSNVTLDPGDVIVLLGHRVAGDVDRGALIAHVEAAGPVEHVLVARFDRDDAGLGDAIASARRPPAVATLIRAAAALFLALALVFAR